MFSDSTKKGILISNHLFLVKTNWLISTTVYMFSDLTSAVNILQAKIPIEIIKKKDVIKTEVYWDLIETSSRFYFTLFMQLPYFLSGIKILQHWFWNCTLSQNTSLFFIKFWPHICHSLHSTSRKSACAHFTQMRLFGLQDLCCDTLLHGNTSS